MNLVIAILAAALVGLCCALTFVLGYKWRDVRIAVATLQTARKEARRRDEVMATKPATLVDPDDVVAQAKWEHEQQMKKLNPNDDL